MTGSGYQQLHAIVHGRVQGVSFRYYTMQEASRLRLTGWVRNRPDRTVEVRAEGPVSSLRDLLEYLHRGSPSARVTRVDTEWLPATHRFTGFAIRHHDTD